MSRARRRLLIGATFLSVASILACSGRAARTAPLSDPAALADRHRAAVPESPYRVRLAWEYTDPRGPVSGEGVLRYTPPDSLRLDLFGPGDGSMAVALAGSGLRSAGQIEDVRLPPPPFLYASAGLFRPGSASLREGYRTESREVLVYPADGPGTLHFFFRGPQLRRVEERREGRVVRELTIEWPEDGGPWPDRAEYRDRLEESRARWETEEAVPVEEPFPRDIYELPVRP